MVIVNNNAFSSATMLLLVYHDCTSCNITYLKVTIKVTIFCELVVWRILRVLNFTLSPHEQVVAMRTLAR